MEKSRTVQSGLSRSKNKVESGSRKSGRSKSRLTSILSEKKIVGQPINTQDMTRIQDPQEMQQERNSPECCRRESTNVSTAIGEFGVRSPMSSDENRAEGNNSGSSKKKTEEYLNRNVESLVRGKVVFPEVDCKNSELQQHAMQLAFENRGTVVEKVLDDILEEQSLQSWNVVGSDGKALRRSRRRREENRKSYKNAKKVWIKGVTTLNNATAKNITTTTTTKNKYSTILTNENIKKKIKS
jgi:hypothetical protein